MDILVAVTIGGITSRQRQNTKCKKKYVFHALVLSINIRVRGRGLQGLLSIRRHDGDVLRHRR